MSNLYSTAAWKCRLAKPANLVTKLVLARLADFADGSGFCFPSIERICGETGMVKSSVLKQMLCLETAGLIRRQPGFRGRNTTYILDLEAMQACAISDSEFVSSTHQASVQVRITDSSAPMGPPHGPHASATKTSQVRDTDHPGPHYGHQSSYNPQGTTMEPPMVKDVFDLPFETPEFISAWNDWKTHRRELGAKGKLTGTAARLQLAQLKKMGLPRAVAALQHSTQKGWTGIYEPKPEPTTPKRNGYASII